MAKKELEREETLEEINYNKKFFLQVAIKIIDKTQLNPSSLQKVGLQITIIIFTYHFYTI